MSDDTRIALLENNLSHIGETLKRLERKMDDGFLENKKEFDRLEQKMDKNFGTLDVKIDAINNRLWILYFWVTGGFAAVLGVIAKSHHWF